MPLTCLDDDISARTPLLEGLEHQLHSALQPAWQRLVVLLQQPGGSQQHSHVRVMAACMHAPGMLHA